MQCSKLYEVGDVVRLLGDEVQSAGSCALVYRSYLALGKPMVAVIFESGLVACYSQEEAASSLIKMYRSEVARTPKTMRVILSEWSAGLLCEIFECARNPIGAPTSCHVW